MAAMRRNKGISLKKSDQVIGVASQIPMQRGIAIAMMCAALKLTPSSKRSGCAREAKRLQKAREEKKNVIPPMSG